MNTGAKILLGGVVATGLYFAWRQPAQAIPDTITNNNAQAFLDTIRYAEGTAGPNGYRTMFTGDLFNGYEWHPNELNCYGSLCSTAAGAYQFLYSTWVYLAARLGLEDFTPANQDLAALELIREKGALADVLAGRFDTAVYKLNKTWASLPGSPYGQPTHTLAELRDVFVGYDGQITQQAIYLNPMPGYYKAA